MTTHSERKINDQLQKLGFADLGEYLAQRPSTPYPDLADELGGDVLGIEIADAELRRAHDSGPASFRAAARDALVRCLRQTLTGGWSKTTDPDGEVSPDFINVTAWSHWSSMIKSVAAVDEIVSAVWEQLKRNAPVGWSPTSADDEVIRRAFDTAWPADRK